MVDHSPEREGKGKESPSTATHDAHDITSLSDLPARRMRTKLWPMSPIESLSVEEVRAIANRDETPVLIAVLDGDETGEQYLCSSKRGASVPPNIAAEGPWAQKCYQQVALLNTTVKELRAEFQPVWELVKAQQIMLIAVELSDGLQEVANKGLRRLYNSWSTHDAKSIITSKCDFRSPRQVHYFAVLKNYTRGGFNSLDHEKFQWVEDLLLEGEKYLEKHAQSHGFHCPPNLRDMFKEFLLIKRDRNIFSHPLTLARDGAAYGSIQILKNSVINDEFPYFKNAKDLLLLGANYAESILQAYGKVKGGHFLDPKGRGKNPLSPPDSDSDPEESSRGVSPAHSPLSIHSPHADHLLYDEDYQVGESSQHPSSPQDSMNDHLSNFSPPSSSPYHVSPLQPRSSRHASPPSSPPLESPQFAAPSEDRPTPPKRALSTANTLSPNHPTSVHVLHSSNPLKRPPFENAQPSQLGQNANDQNLYSSPSGHQPSNSQSSRSSAPLKKQKERQV